MTLQALGRSLGQPVRVSCHTHPWFNQTGLLIALCSHKKTAMGVVSYEKARVIMGDGQERTFTPDQLQPIGLIVED